MRIARARCDQPHVECVVTVPDEPVRAPADEHHAALLSRPLDDLLQTVDVPDVRRVEPEPVCGADRLLVERLQFGIRDVFDLRGSVQQFTVQERPAEILGQSPGQLGTPRSVLPRHGDQPHGHPAGGKKRSPAWKLASGGA